MSKTCASIGRCPRTHSGCSPQTWGSGYEDVLCHRRDLRRVLEGVVPVVIGAEGKRAGLGAPDREIVLVWPISKRIEFMMRRRTVLTPTSTASSGFTFVELPGRSAVTTESGCSPKPRTSERCVLRSLRRDDRRASTAEQEVITANGTDNFFHAPCSRGGYTRALCWASRGR